MKKTQGFTLIELLVVIAIIGILSSVVLASLNTARAKGADAAIKANLAGIRAQAENTYDTGNTYTNVCSDATVVNQIGSAKAASGVTSATVVALATIGASGQATCHSGNDSVSSVNGWAVEVPLKSNPALFACVDYTGTSTVTTGFSLIASDIDCGAN